jgi:hypothetical protein
MNTISATALTALRAEGANVKNLAAALAGDVEVPLEQAAEVVAPKQVEITPALAEALKHLPEVFGIVQPDTIRRLTAAEIKALHDERSTIKAVIEDLLVRKDSIDETVRNHMSVTAQVAGLVTETTELDKNGRPIIAAPKDPQRCNIPDSTEAWSLEFRAGKVTVDGAELLAMYERDEISRETYLSFTKEVRIFDEEKAMAAMRKNPDLIETVFTKILKRGRAATALFVRKQSKK